jgi:hypothetical protein
MSKATILSLAKRGFRYALIGFWLSLCVIGYCASESYITTPDGQSRSVLSTWLGTLWTRAGMVVSGMATAVPSAEPNDDDGLYAVSLAHALRAADDMYNAPRDATVSSAELYRNESTAVFQYSPDKSSDDVVSKLREFRGKLTADAEHRFNAVYTSGAILECGCNAHGRRKFRDAYIAPMKPPPSRARTGWVSSAGVEQEGATRREDRSGSSRCAHSTSGAEYTRLH